MELQALIEQAGKNDSDAFAQLVSLYEDPVYTFVLRMSGNPESALDLALDTFRRAWQAISLYRFDCSFSVWIARISCSACTDALRKKKRSRAGAAEPADAMTNAQVVFAALQRLPLEQRTAVCLCAWLSEEEAAAAAGCDAEVMRWRLQEGMEQLGTDETVCRAGGGVRETAHNLYGAVDAAIKSAETSAPASLSTAVVQSIRNEQKRYGPREWLHRWRFTAAAVVIILIVLLIGRSGILSSKGSSSETQEEQTEPAVQTAQPETEFHAAGTSAD